MSKKYNAVANASQSASQTFVKGAAILTVSMVVVKVFGVLDKVILTNIYSMFGQSLASMGMGIYNNAYEVFVVIFTVATGGLPIVISRLISENMTQKRYKDVKQIHSVSIPLFLVVGLVCTIGLMLVSFPYAFKFVKSPYSIYAMLALAPTVLFGCIASIYRGYFEGQRNMFPTAVSEVIEAVVKLVFLSCTSEWRITRRRATSSGSSSAISTRLRTRSSRFRSRAISAVSRLRAFARVSF